MGFEKSLSVLYLLFSSCIRTIIGLDWKKLLDKGGVWFHNGLLLICCFFLFLIFVVFPVF